MEDSIQEVKGFGCMPNTYYHILGSLQYQICNHFTDQCDVATVSDFTSN